MYLLIHHHKQFSVN